MGVLQGLLQSAELVLPTTLAVCEHVEMRVCIGTGSHIKNVISGSCLVQIKKSPVSPILEQFFQDI